MKKEKYDQLRENTESLLENKSSNTLALEGFKFIKPSFKRSVFLIILFIASSIIYNRYFIISGEVIPKFLNLVKEVNEIFIPTFAVIITGYAIFQALTNGSTLITLITVKDKDRNKFVAYNKSFFGITILYLSIIILNLMLYIIFSNLPTNWSITVFSSELNNTLASIMISFYFVLIIHSLIEIKNFIYNLYQTFNFNAFSTAVQELKSANEAEKQKQTTSNE